MLREVENIYKEHLNLYDTVTRKCVLAVNEADQNQILASLCSKLYQKIVDKVDDIDFGEIPETKGDITKLSNYSQLVESLEIIEGILIQYHQDTKCTDIIKQAINNIETRVDMFEKGFRYNVEIVIVTYSTMVLSVISSVSFLISSCIEYIKLPNQDTFKATIDKVALVKSKNNLLFSNLARFNRMCKTGEFDKVMDFSIKNVSQEKGLLGIETGVALGTVALILLITSIIPLLRELIFFFYYTRVRIADYFEIQANLLQMNAYNIQNTSDLPTTKRKEISNKQLKIANFFRNISNKLQISAKQSELNTEKEIKSDNTKYKSDDLLETMPDSAASTIF